MESLNEYGPSIFKLPITNPFCVSRYFPVKKENSKLIVEKMTRHSITEDFENRDVSLTKGDIVILLENDR